MKITLAEFMMLFETLRDSTAFLDNGTFFTYNEEVRIHLMQSLFKRIQQPENDMEVKT